jgi:hypothetical protein
MSARAGIKGNVFRVAVLKKSGKFAGIVALSGRLAMVFKTVFKVSKGPRISWSHSCMTIRYFRREE